MKITLSLLYDHLTMYEPQLYQNEAHESRGWFQMAFYEEGREYQEEYLLLGKAEQFSDSLAGRGVISIGMPKQELLEKNDVLCFLQQEKLLTVFQAIQDVILKYNQWELALREALQKNQTLEQLFLIAAEAFGNSMFMHDDNFCLMVSVNHMPGEHDWEYNETRRVYMVPSELMDDFRVNPDYIKTMFTVKPSIYPRENMGYAILYQNLWYKSRYRARICINELGRKLRRSDFYLLDYFSGIVLEYLKQGEFQVMQQSASLSHLLMQLADGENLERNLADKTLMQYGWTSKDTYVCICLKLEETGAKTYSVPYQCARLSDKFAYSCAFSHGDAIVLVMNHTLNEVAMPDLKNQLAVILRESLMKAGISTLCNDLMQFSYYYRQALCAFETGRKKDSTFWCYSFSDYQSDYILQKALEEFPASLLCKNEIRVLKEYDETHTSNLELTLRSYLENDRNIARTSEVLEIHRSTLLYRIDRIRELTGADLENPQVRFELLLSYHILDAGSK